MVLRWYQHRVILLGEEDDRGTIGLWSGTD